MPAPTPFGNLLVGEEFTLVRHGSASVFTKTGEETSMISRHVRASRKSGSWTQLGALTSRSRTVYPTGTTHPLLSPEPTTPNESMTITEQLLLQALTASDNYINLLTAIGDTEISAGLIGITPEELNENLAGLTRLTQQYRDQ